MEYMGVLERLRQEREGNGFSQKGLGSILGMTQGHYSKAESGMKRFSYQQLQRMNRTGMDLHYIFTGNRGAGEELTASQSESRTVTAVEYYYMSQVFHAVFRRYCEGQERHRYQKLYDQSRTLQCILDMDHQNLFRVLRSYTGLTQIEMAEILEIDRKKYVLIENGRQYPDSELVFQLYKHYGIPPQFVLGDKRGILNSVCDILQTLEERDRTAMTRVLDEVWNI